MKKIFYFLLIITSTLISQEKTGSISGKIIDQSTKQPLSAANVLLLETNYGAVSNNNGEFVISNVPVGNYKIRASMIGYKSVIKSDVVVHTGKPAIVNFELGETVIELSGIEVTSDYFQKDPNEATSVTNFTYEEIRRAPGGFEDVVRALSVLPGIAQADAGRNDLIVRGGAPSENLYVVDGITVPNINHFGSQGATGGPLSYIDLNYVEGTTFSSGGFSALYGDKLSSVLKIDLRDARNDRIGGKANISATQFGLSAEGPITENSGFIFSARRSYLDFIFKAAGFGFVPEYYDVLTKFNYNFDKRNSLSYIFISAFDNVKFFNETSDQRYSNSRTLGNDQIQYVTGLNFRHLFNKGFYKISLNRNYVDYNFSQKDSLQNPIFLNKSLEAENNLTADILYKINPASEITSGAAVKLIKFRADVKFPAFVTTFGDTLTLNELYVKDNFIKSNAFAQFSTIFKNKIKANIGARVDFFSGIEKSFSLSPRFSLSYLITDLTSLNFASGIFKQSPSYIWLKGNEQNRNLKMIEANHLVLGLEHKIRKDVLLKLEGYLKYYKNYPASQLRPYLVLANTGAGFSGSEDNFSSFGLEPLVSEGKGNVRGLEFLAQKKFSEIPLYGIFSLTYSEANFTALDGIERRGNYDQSWIINLSGGYIFNEKWEASAKFRYATGKPYTPFNFDGTQNVEFYNSVRTNPLHSLDVRVDRRWNFESWNLIAYIDVQNIYNRNNVSFIRWDARENKVDEDSSIGILPSIGITIEF